MPSSAVRRTVVLIDGFNLYHGLRASSARRHLWLDLQALSESLLKGDQVLVAVHYFTAMVRDDPPGHKRQDVYLQALQGHCDRVHVCLGRFQERRVRCAECGAGRTEYEEKESDAALAARLVEIAANRSADVVLVISGDADFVPAFRAARRVNPNLRLVAVFPPHRISEALKAEADAWLNLGHARIRQSQLPPLVDGPTGPLLRPEHWSGEPG